MTGKILKLVFSILMFASLAQAQTAEVTVSFNEQFFDTVLDAVFKNLKKPEFPLALNKSGVQNTDALISSFNTAAAVPPCSERITLHREINGVRTAARFRNGRIYAPIAFSGSYNPPLIGCLDFQGVAETDIELEYDRRNQTLIGKIKVMNVQLGSVANLAGGMIAKFVQNSIDKKVNPIEILKADKLSFIVPVQNSGGALSIKATNLRHEVGNGVLNVYVSFEFSKAG